MSAVRWEDPPESTRSDWISVLDQLRQRPGIWALIGEDVTTAVVTRINKGRIKGTSAGEFEARGINQTRQGRVEKIYARYIGGATS